MMLVSLAVLLSSMMLICLISLFNVVVAMAVLVTNLSLLVDWLLWTHRLFGWLIGQAVYANFMGCRFKRFVHVSVRAETKG